MPMIPYPKTTLSKAIDMANRDLSTALDILEDVTVINGAQFKEFYDNWEGWGDSYLEVDDMEISAVKAIWGDTNSNTAKIVITDSARLNLKDLGYVVSTKGQGTVETRRALLNHFANSMKASLSYTREELADIAGRLSDSPEETRAQFLKSPHIGLMACITELFMRKDLLSLESFKIRKAYEDMSKHGHLLCSDETNNLEPTTPRP